MLRTFVLFLNLLQHLAQRLPLRALLQHQLPPDLWGKKKKKEKTKIKNNSFSLSLIFLTSKPTLRVHVSTPSDIVFRQSLTWSWTRLGFVCLCSHFKFLLALRYTVHSPPGVHEHGGAGFKKQPTCRRPRNIFRTTTGIYAITYMLTSNWCIWLTWTGSKYLLAWAQWLQQVEERYAVILREVEQKNPQHLQVLYQGLGFGSQLVPQRVQVVTDSLDVGENPNKTFL